MDILEEKCKAITISIVAICIAVIACTLILELQKTNRCAIENGLSKQYSSNVSGWIKK